MVSVWHDFKGMNRVAVKAHQSSLQTHWTLIISYCNVWEKVIGKTEIRLVLCPSVRVREWLIKPRCLIVSWRLTPKSWGNGWDRKPSHTPPIKPTPWPIPFLSWDFSFFERTFATNLLGRFYKVGFCEMPLRKSKSEKWCRLNIQSKGWKCYFCSHGIINIFPKATNYYGYHNTCLGIIIQALKSIQLKAEKKSFTICSTNGI